MDEVEVTRNGRTNQFSVTPVHGSDTIRCIVSVASVSIPDERSDWASKTPIVVHPLWSDPRWQRPASQLCECSRRLCACCQSGPRRRGLHHHSSGWSGGAWRHKQ